MIFVAAGTQDGRELAGRLLSEGYPVIASVVSRYGSEPDWFSWEWVKKR